MHNIFVYLISKYIYICMFTALQFWNSESPRLVHVHSNLWPLMYMSVLPSSVPLSMSAYFIHFFFRDLYLYMWGLAPICFVYECYDEQHAAFCLQCPSCSVRDSHVCFSSWFTCTFGSWFTWRSYTKWAARRVLLPMFIMFSSWFACISSLWSISVDVQAVRCFIHLLTLIRFFFL